MTVPSTLTAGDTWEWTRDLADYPAGTWVLTYYLTMAGVSVPVVATADGTTHEVSVPAATTAAYTAGSYRWTARATSGSDAFTVEDGWVEVKPNPATSKADPRSNSRQMLDALNCFLLGNATTAQASMSINGRALSRWPLEQLRAWRNELRQEVRSETGGGSGRDIKARFVSG
jgi:hypothetical protein